MTVPSRQADEALDRLIDYAGWATTPKPHKDAVATVRAELERLQRENQANADAFELAMRHNDHAEAELERLRGIERANVILTTRHDAEQAARIEAEKRARRLEDGLREIERQAPDGTAARAVQIARALLADQPDGGETE